MKLVYCPPVPDGLFSVFEIADSLVRRLLCSLWILAAKITLVCSDYTHCEVCVVPGPVDRDPCRRRHGAASTLD